MILDIGCGFRKGAHQKRGQIGLDLNRGMCDIVADAHHLPFRSRIFDRILLYAVLEHLDNPFECLRECQRVSKWNSRIEIVIPEEARGSIVFLKSMIFEFPLGIYRVLKTLLRSRKGIEIRRFGTPHKNRIKAEHLRPFVDFGLVEFQGNHAWFGLLKKLTGKEIYFPFGVSKNIYIEGTVKTPEKH